MANTALPNAPELLEGVGVHIRRGLSVNLGSTASRRWRRLAREELACFPSLGSMFSNSWSTKMSSDDAAPEAPPARLRFEVGI